MQPASRTASANTERSRGRWKAVLKSRQSGLMVASCTIGAPPALSDIFPMVLNTYVDGACYPLITVFHLELSGISPAAGSWPCVPYRVVTAFGIRSATDRPRASGFTGLSLCYPLNRPSAGFHYFCRALTLVTGYQGQRGPWKPPVATAEPPRSWSTAF